jgi:hypothetical protein
MVAFAWPRRRYEFGYSFLKSVPKALSSGRNGRAWTDLSWASSLRRPTRCAIRCSREWESGNADSQALVAQIVCATVPNRGEIRSERRETRSEQSRAFEAANVSSELRPQLRDLPCHAEPAPAHDVGTCGLDGSPAEAGDDSGHDVTKQLARLRECAGVIAQSRVRVTSPSVEGRRPIA